MPLPKDRTYTSEDYWNLPEGERAELIGGKLYAMAPPNRMHQELVSAFNQVLRNHIDSKGGSCRVYPAPFAVNLDASNEDWVEPDISVICDKSKLTDRGCSGAPDFIIEIVSPTSRKHDYAGKNALYSQAGVREYWIVDPVKKKVVTYFYEQDSDPSIFSFDVEIPVKIFPDLTIRIMDLIKEY